jgi:hypothetical protein
MSPLAAKKRLYELKSIEYLIYEKIFHKKSGIYRAGTKGIAITNDELPAVKIRLGSYEHDMQLVDLAIALEQKTGAHWQTDRQIRHEKGLKGVGSKGHSPDGILIYPTNEKIAVELELSEKGTKRLEKILKEYANSQYKAVWYYISSQSIAAKILSAGFPKIKAYTWPEMQEIKAEPKQQPKEKEPKANEKGTAAISPKPKPEQITKDFFRRN